MQEERPIRVLLADDHTMFRQGLASILTSYGGMEVVAQVPNGEVALRLGREKKPDVVIMRVQMPFERAKDPSDRCARPRRPPRW